MSLLQYKENYLIDADDHLLLLASQQLCDPDENTTHVHVTCVLLTKTMKLLLTPMSTCCCWPLSSTRWLHVVPKTMEPIRTTAIICLVISSCRATWRTTKMLSSTKRLYVVLITWVELIRMSPIPICLLSWAVAVGLPNVPLPKCNWRELQLTCSTGRSRGACVQPHLSHHHRCKNNLLAPVSEKELVENIQSAVPNAEKKL